MRLVLAQGHDALRFDSDLLQHVIMFFQLSHLLFREVLLIVRLALEGQRVEGVLWVLLVEDVVLAVLPVWEVLLIAREADDGFGIVVKLPALAFLRAGVVVRVSHATSRLHFHAVRVDDFGLFFEVERFAFLNDERVLQLLLEVFLVAAEQRLGIGVANELVSATGLASSLVLWIKRSGIEIRITVIIFGMQRILSVLSRVESFVHDCLVQISLFPRRWSAQTQEDLLDRR